MTIIKMQNANLKSQNDNLKFKSLRAWTPAFARVTRKNITLFSSVIKKKGQTPPENNLKFKYQK